MKTRGLLVLGALLIAASAYAWSGGGWAGSDIPGGAAGGDLFGTYPSPGVTDDSHSHGDESITSIPRAMGPTIGAYYGIPGGATYGTGVLAFSTGNTTYWPIVVHQSIDITKVAIEVTTQSGTGGAVVLVALYNANQSWQPTTKVADFGSLAIDSTGAKTATIEAVTLPPGRYMIGARWSATATLRTFSYTIPDAPAVNGAGATPFVYTLYVAEAYASPMPTTATAWTSTLNSATGWATFFVFAWTLTP